MFKNAFLVQPLLVTECNLLELSLGYRVMLVGSAGLWVLVPWLCWPWRWVGCVSLFVSCGSKSFLEGKLAREPPGPGVSLAGRCLITGSVTVIVTGPFGVFISACDGFCRSCFFKESIHFFWCEDALRSISFSLSCYPKFSEMIFLFAVLLTLFHGR